MVISKKKEKVITSNRSCISHFSTGFCKISFWLWPKEVQKKSIHGLLLEIFGDPCSKLVKPISNYVQQKNLIFARLQYLATQLNLTATHFWVATQGLRSTAISHALRIVTGCLRPTSTDNRFSLADIQPMSFAAKKPYCL